MNVVGVGTLGVCVYVAAWLNSEHALIRQKLEDKIRILNARNMELPCEGRLALIFCAKISPLLSRRAISCFLV